ncbi:MAG: acyltransferase family protein [Eubacteriales bacterium]|nr:acyltransferase family protein [Eubacteriales bacterium]
MNEATIFNMPQRGARLPFVDISKGIVILLCVLGHAVAFQGITFFYIFSFHMPFFFLISGWCRENRNADEKFLPNIKKWFVKLIIPSLLFKAVRFWNPENPVDWLKTIFLDPEAEWFLSSMFVANIIFFFYKKFDLKSRNKYLKIGVTGAFVCIPPLFAAYYLYLELHMKKGLFFSFDCVLIALSFMIIGYCIHKCNRRFPIPKMTVSLAVLTVILLAICAKLILVNSYVNISNAMTGNSDIFFYFSAVFLSCLVVYLSGYMQLAGYKNKLMAAVNRLLELWGRYSLWIYLVHLFLFDYFIKFTTEKQIVMNSGLKSFVFTALAMLIITPVLYAVDIIKHKRALKKADKKVTEV